MTSPIYPLLLSLWLSLSLILSLCLQSSPLHFLCILNHHKPFFSPSILSLIYLALYICCLPTNASNANPSHLRLYCHEYSSKTKIAINTILNGISLNENAHAFITCETQFLMGYVSHRHMWFLNFTIALHSLRISPYFLMTYIHIWYTKVSVPQLRSV